METIAFVVGIAAVILYLAGYQQKKRKNIILFNASSRVLYVVQYLLLGAFEGALLDIAGTVSSVFAQKKEVPFIKKHQIILLVLMDALIIASGLVVYKNVFSLLPIIGVLLHTSCFWIENEKTIRRISLLGCPFWLTYNFISGAYGSCIGDVLSMVSLIIGMIRFDIKRGEKKEHA